MEKAMDIFYDMKRRRKHRNTILYTTLIKGCGLEKDIRTALTLFREMRDEGVPYNTITYNSIIDACIKCSDVQSAEELLREMLAPGSNLEPDLITYSTLLKGYCHVGDLDKALQVAETIKACGLKCDELVYNTLMDGCVKANDLSAGIGLFAEMTQGGMKPSSITHSILVRLYQRNGYKGDCFDAVAQLYQHHGLERPNGVMERSGKGNNGNRHRGDRFRNNQSNGFREQTGRNGGAQPGVDNVAGGWEQGGGVPGMHPPHYPGVSGMPPHMSTTPGALPPHLMVPPDHLSGFHPSMSSRENELDAYGVAAGQLPYGMHMEAFLGGPHMGHPPGGVDAADRGMGMYMSQGAPPRGMPPLGGPSAMYAAYGMTAPSAAGGPLMHPAGPGARYPRGRLPDGGLDASCRQGPPPLDPNLPPWMQGGVPDMPYPISTMPPGAPKAYLDRMVGLPDGGPPLVPGVGGPAPFGEY
jgi:pentatricopeptide repeat protein